MTPPPSTRTDHPAHDTAPRTSASPPRPLPTDRATRSNSSRRLHEVLLVGVNDRTRRYLEATATYASRGVRVIGVLDLDCADLSPSPYREECQASLDELGIPQLGTVSDLRQVLRQQPVDEVHVTLPIKSCYIEIDEVLATCEVAGVPASLSADLFERSSAQLAVVTPRNGRGRLSYSCVHRTLLERALKRGMDIAGSLFALTVLALPMTLIALAIKLTSRGPVFFVQERLGRNHRPFRMLKFRTMVVNAEALKATLQESNEMGGPVFKMRRDPRVTPLGRFLRKFSLDELPQFINVLRGEMSLVGPRPPIASEVAEYDWWHRRRLCTRPGLTCLWQVSGRNEIDFDDWMRLDLEYIDCWSLTLDVKLLLQTVPTVLFGRGAS